MEVRMVQVDPLVAEVLLVVVNVAVVVVVEGVTLVGRDDGEDGHSGVRGGGVLLGGLRTRGEQKRELGRLLGLQQLVGEPEEGDESGEGGNGDAFELKEGDDYHGD